MHTKKGWYLVREIFSENVALCALFSVCMFSLFMGLAVYLAFQSIQCGGGGGGDQSCTQSPQAFCSVGGLWGNGKKKEFFDWLFTVTF